MVKPRKWKRVRDGSRRQRVWKKLNSVDPATASVKTLILVTVILALILIPTTAYYYNNVAPYESGGKPGGPNDPFSTLWNGQVQAQSAPGFQSISTATVGTGVTSYTMIGISVQQNDLILLSDYTPAGGASFITTVTDTASNSYAQQSSFGNGALTGRIWYAQALTTAVLNVTTNYSSLGYYHKLAIAVYTGWTSFGNANEASCNQTTSCDGAGSNTLTITTSANSITVEFWIFFKWQDGSCVTDSASSSQNIRHNWSCTDVVASPHFGFNGLNLDKGPETAGSHSYNVSWTGGASSAPYGEYGHKVLELKGFSATPGCPIGYSCLLATKDTSGDITLASNSTHQAVAIATSLVDLSPGSTKSLAFSFTTSGASTRYTGEMYAWGLRANGTLPTEAGWSPTSDNSVSLLFLMFIKNAATNQADYYLYIQRQPGQSLGLSSGNDPYPYCPQTSTLFICGRDTGSNALLYMQTVLNFTGGSQAGSTTHGTSYICTNIGSGGFSCAVGGSGNSQTIYASTVQHLNYTFPWLNLQDSYHPFIWQGKATGGSSIKFLSNPTIVDRFVISYFDTAGTGITSTGGGGLFGWMGRSLGGAWSFISGGVATVLGPILDMGNGLMQAFIAALIQGFSLMAKGLELLLNAIGTFLGVGNIGTTLITFFTNMVNFLTNIVGTALGWMIATTSAMVAFVSFIASMVTNGVLTILTTLVNLLVTLFGFIWTVIAIFFRYSVASSFILMLDWLFGIMSVWVNGVRGFIRWINFNIVAFTKFFRALYWVLNEAVNAILKIVGTIRGSGTGSGVGV